MRAGGMTLSAWNALELHAPLSQTGTPQANLQRTKRRSFLKEVLVTGLSTAMRL